MSLNKAKRDVDKALSKRAKENEKELNSALIIPFSEDFQFSTNGVYYFCGRMGSGKTYNVLRLVMITDRFTGKPYFDQIILSSTSGADDKTVQTFRDQISTPITAVSDKQLMAFLAKNVKQKRKYYAIMKLVTSSLQTVDDEMKRIIAKHKLRDQSGFNLRKLTSYIVSKLARYPFSKYPSNTFLILDDYGGNDLLNKVNSPLASFITKVRHYNFTVCIMCQTWRHINKNIKRLCTDIVIFQGYSLEDFQTMIEQSGATQNWHELWERYSRLSSPRSYMELHIIAGSVVFCDVEWNQKTLF